MTRIEPGYLHRDPPPPNSRIVQHVSRATICSLASGAYAFASNGFESHTWDLGNFFNGAPWGVAFYAGLLVVGRLLTPTNTRT